MNSTCLNATESAMTPILRWVAPILVSVGIVGNILVLMIFGSSKNGIRAKTHVFLTAMAAFDLAHSFAAAVLILHLYENSIDSQAFSRFYNHDAKPILWTIVNFLAMTSTWLAVAATVERFMVVRYPLKARSFTRKHVRWFIVFCIAACSFLVTSYYLFSFRPHAVADCGKPAAKIYRLQSDTSLWRYGHASRQLHSVMCTIIPIALLLYYNVSIVCRLRKSRHILVKMEQREHVRPSVMKKQRHVTCVVLSISATTALLLMPSAVLLVVFDAIAYDIISMPPWYYVAAEVSNTLVLLEKVLDFFLYYLSSKEFRRGFKLIFKLLV